MATSSAKSGKTSSSASKSTKKKTSASSSQKNEEQSDGLGLGTILNVVEQLAGGGGSGNGKKKPKADSSPLAALLSSLTGGGNSDGGSINYASIIEMLLPLLLSNSKHTESFKSNPSKTIHQLTGVNVSDQHLGPIVEQVLSKLNSK